MILKLLTVGDLQVNCYILADENTKEAIIIDPGAEPQTIKRCISINKLKPLFIINTHGHADHIGANRFLNLPVWIHELDKDFLVDSEKNLSAAFGIDVISPEAEHLIKDGEKIKLGTITLSVMHTPGHTPGSISLQFVPPTPDFRQLMSGIPHMSCKKLGLGGNNVVFTGDALFYEGIGRTDFPYASEKKLLDAIRNKILVLADETIIYPGHGPSSSVGHEKKNNPFL